MQATVERAEALRLLRIEHRSVAALIDELTDEEMTRRDTIQYGIYYDQECSFKDLLAHLICYEVYTLEAIRAWRRGSRHWAIDAVNDPRRGREIHYGGIAERAGSSLAAQVDEYQRVSAALEREIDDMTDQDWRSAPSFAPDAAADLGGMIEGILVLPPRPPYRHLPVHIPDAGQ